MPFGLGLIANPSRAPGPTDISSTNVSTNGGSGVITGLNFAQGMAGQNPLAYVLLGTVYVQLTIAWSSSTKLLYTLPAGSYTAGTYELTIINPDGQSDTKPIFQITSVSDPQTIIGANLWAWYRSDFGVTVVGGVVTKWADKGPNGLDLTPTSTNPAYAVSSPNGFNGLPSITFDGVANTLANTTGASLGSNTVFIYQIIRYVSLGTSKVVVCMQGSTGRTTLGTISSTQHDVNYSGLVDRATAVGTANTSPCGVYAYCNGTGASAETIGINLANTSELTTTSTQAEPAGTHTVSIGSRLSAAGTFANVEVVEVIIANAMLTTSQLNDLYKYANFRYNLDATLSVSRAMDVLASTGTESRILGAGFNTTTGVQIVVGGTPTSVTATYLGSSSISLSGLPPLAAGQYDAIVTNASSGASLFVSNAINVTATKTPTTIFGRNCLLFNRCDNATLNGSNLSAFLDLACAGWAFGQTVAADQGPYNTTDANFNSVPSTSTTGSPVTLQTGTGFADQNPKTMYWIIVVKSRVTQTSAFLLTCSLSSFRLLIDGGGAWGVSAGGTQVSAGTGGTSRTKMTARSSDAGGGNQTLGISNNFGTEVTVTQLGNQTWTGNVFYLGSNKGTANYGKFDIEEIIGLDVVPSGTKLTDLQNYLSSRVGF